MEEIKHYEYYIITFLTKQQTKDINMKRKKIRKEDTSTVIYFNMFINTKSKVNKKRDREWLRAQSEIHKTKNMKEKNK